MTVHEWLSFSKDELGRSLTPCFSVSLSSLLYSGPFCKAWVIFKPLLIHLFTYKTGAVCLPWATHCAKHWNWDSWDQIPVLKWNCKQLQLDQLVTMVEINPGYRGEGHQTGHLFATLGTCELRSEGFLMQRKQPLGSFGVLVRLAMSIELACEELGWKVERERAGQPTPHLRWFGLFWRRCRVMESVGN